MARRVYVVLVALLLVTTVVFAFLWALAGRHCQEMRMTIRELSGVRESNLALQDSLRMVAGSLSSAKDSAEAEADQRILLDQVDIRRLKKLGLSDPATQLRRDLVAHPELIPYEGVLGGTMGFVEHRVTLLSTRWVFAEFEDGHIMGSCLLEYNVARGGRLSWKVLSATLN
ncbi:MAG: hypothetical protein NTX17_00165 [Candidatus Eisenbacteria bacterium]|nr:hypothetical protein [Candidatus Eisenbacteria bacterium]